MRSRRPRDHGSRTPWPHSLRELAAQLLDNVAELLVLLMATLKGMAAAVTEQRMKAVRAVAAQKFVQSLERVKGAIHQQRAAFGKARHQLVELHKELLDVLDELSDVATPHLPKEAESDDEDYF